MMRFAWVAAGLLFGGAAMAADTATEDIPPYTVLECESGCPQVTPAARLQHELPHYLDTLGGFRHPPGALLDVSYTIGTDGHVKDIVVERRIGRIGFEAEVRGVMSGWTFTPAMVGGVPVEENERTRITFYTFSRNARDEITDAYKKAVALNDAGKSDESLTALRAIEAQDDLNFFERCMVAYTMALIDVQKGEYYDALDQSRIATLDQARHLDKRVRGDAIRMQIKLEAANGNPSEAFAWYKILQDDHDVSVDDASTALVDKLHAQIDGPDPMVTEAKVAPESVTPVWQHTLSRRTFAFSAVKGKLDRFDLRCKNNHIQSAVSDTAQWTVPKSWRDCELYVTGKPDTTFQFVELKP
jgi:TonB-like protein